MKKSLLSLLLGVLLLIPGYASAVNVDDLDGLIVCQTFRGVELSGMENQAVAGASGVFSKVKGYSDRLHLDNFYGSPADFELKNNKLYLIGMNTSSGQSTYTYDENNNRVNVKLQLVIEEIGQLDYTTYYKYDTKTQANFYGNVNQGSDGRYTIILAAWDAQLYTALQFSKRGSSTKENDYLTDAENTFLIAELRCFKPNAKIPYTGSEGLVHVTKTQTGNTVNYKIFNIGGAGTNFWTKDGYNAIDLDSYAMEGNLQNKTVKIAAGAVSIVTSHNYVCADARRYPQYHRVSHYNFDHLYITSDHTLNLHEIKGKYVPAGDPAHNNAPTYWTEKSNGQLKTYLKHKIKLDSWGIWNESNDKYLFYNSDGTELSDDIFCENIEVTHDVQMTVNNFDVASQGDQVYASVTIDSRVNNDYIESYDLYFVPGTYTSAADANFKHHDEKGHSDAILIEEGIIPMATFAANGDQGYTLEINKGVPEVVNIPNRKKGAPYTLFLKANYNNGLHPTFHALATQATVTGLEELEAQECVKVEVVAGGLNVTGESNVEVYTTAGTLVYNGQAGNIELAAGLYIVRIGNHIEKVLVK